MGYYDDVVKDNDWDDQFNDDPEHHLIYNSSFNQYEERLEALNQRQEFNTPIARKIRGQQWEITKFYDKMISMREMQWKYNAPYSARSPDHLVFPLYWGFLPLATKR